MSRCVRRACLRGEGALDRKEWIEHRLEELAQIFRHRAKAARSRGSRLDSFVALSLALSHDFPPAQTSNFRRFAAQSVKWAVGQFGTMPALFSPRCLRSARVSMAASEVLARVADVASSDLLDFIVELAHRLLHRQPSSAQILTAHFGPATADRGSRRIRDQPRNPPKSTEKRIRINSPFLCPSVLSVVTRL